MKTIIFLMIFIFPYALFSQQIADTSYKPIIQNPEYEIGKGSVVFLDEGHHNFHTKNGRYSPFCSLLESDGYKMKEFKGLFTRKKLNKGKILVIANALNKVNITNWYLPTPSAFTKKEVKVLKQWVAEGGSLFLIADHMPMAGAATELAKAFEFEFSNGFVLDTLSNAPTSFSLHEKTLNKNSITSGRNASEQIGQVVTFTGQAFKIPKDATSILTFSENYVNFLTDTAWVFNEKTTKFNVEGWSQGAFRVFDKGKIVVFGEAAMFTAQLAGSQKSKMGMNNEIATENHQLLLNIIHWLDGKLE